MNPRRLDYGVFCSIIHKNVTDWTEDYLQTFEIISVSTLYFSDCGILKNKKEIKRNHNLNG